jgi:cell wall-associated NlpC family hydrolase
MAHGDIILVHEGSWDSRLIQWATHSHWNHCALIGDGQLIEALSSGVQASPLTKYDGIDTATIDTKLDDDGRVEAVAFAVSCIGQGYGWLTIGSAAVALLTNGKLTVGLNGTEICSGLCARALEHAGVILPQAAAQMSPGDLATYFEVTPR